MAKKILAKKTVTKKATRGTKATRMMFDAAPPPEAAPAEEFRNIPLDLIIVESQIRTGVNVDSEAFQGFVDSIAAKGVIEPIVVTPREDKFLLLAGELRYRTALKLGLATIPARILPDIQSAEEILTIQLIENLQRQELDPIDKANAILAFFRNRHRAMAVATIINNLILYGREDQRLSAEIVATVATISKIAGMKTRTLQNILSLLMLTPKIRDAVKTGIIPVSQGYILAADLENPGLMTIFESILENPVTNKRLTELLKRAAETGADAPAEAPSPFQSVYTAGETLTRRLRDGKVIYDLGELANLRKFFLSVIEVIDRAKAGGGTAKEPEPAPEPAPAPTRKKRPA